MADRKDIDLGYEAALASGSEFPPGSDPKTNTLADGSVVQWAMGSSYNPDGSFKGREILMKFDVTIEGRTDPETLYHINLDVKDNRLHVANMTAAQKDGSWSSDFESGQSITPWAASGKSPELPPQVLPTELVSALQGLAQRPEFKEAVNEHATQAKMEAAAPEMDQQTPAAGQAAARRATVLNGPQR